MELKEELSPFAEIKFEIIKIQWNYLAMSTNGKAIEANPSTHRIAEYVHNNFIPKSKVMKLVEALEKIENYHCHNEWDFREAILQMKMIAKKVLLSTQNK